MARRNGPAGARESLPARAATLVGQSQHEGERPVEVRNIRSIQPAETLPEPRAPDCHRFVGHDLGYLTEAVRRRRLNRDPEVRCIFERGRHLADDDRSMLLRKRVALNDHRRARFAEVASGCDRDDITALRCHRTPRPTRPSEATPPHGLDRAARRPPQSARESSSERASRRISRISRLPWARRRRRTERILSAADAAMIDFLQCSSWTVTRYEIASNASCDRDRLPVAAARCGEFCACFVSSLPVRAPGGGMKADC